MPTRPRPPKRPRPNTPNRRQRNTWAHKTTAAQVVAAWRDQHGDLCPGWQRPPHRATDLTADHIRPVIDGGTNDPTNYRVLCRSCNGRRGAQGG